MNAYKRELVSELKYAIQKMDCNAVDYINGSGMDIPGSIEVQGRGDLFARFLKLHSELQDLWTDCDNYENGDATFKLERI